MALTGDYKLISTEDMLQGHAELCIHAYGFVKSMALKCAIELGIPGAIHGNGGGASLGELATIIALPLSRLPRLRRLMRVLTVSGVFSVEHQQPDDSVGCAVAVYGLTSASRLLVGDGETSSGLSSLVSLMVDPNLTAPFSGMSAWFMDDEQPRSFFEMHHGEDMWDMAAREAALSRTIGDGMTDDSRFVVEVILREGRARDVFSGVRSMVDVGGGTGTIAKAIAAAFPHVECSVLDLPHVVAEAPADGESVMHDWRDDECVKILRRCKEAIPTREAGGKVIIINMVVGSEKSKGNSTKKEEAQALYDLFLMAFEGGEREEHEWEKIFLEAGFSGYNIIPALGIRSIIEVYP
ncbi:acetylserotonin O-methyltransferase 1-like isoform X2 [Triticum dicoccoides]|uniref:acetylserotonin O-methyltransferase 1-like isoform X2 n=1 Tax=Triticum dicoccoides TaxID=85692 RepID=UPI00188E0C8B|nr:acetylserotonin O-methyltransferase 1-like isoform X2 [Triticum dicoccoides]